MSGLLRRIKRSPPADAGERLPEGQAAAPEGVPTPAEAPVFGPAPPPGRPAPDAPVFGPAPPPGRPAPEPPVLLADPSVPAGIDPAEAPMRPPAGRRGRLRRRLRYLRRARELMLRDLGGLLYEVHRTGGGDVAGHATIVTAKVQRIRGVDAEAHALETALSASRAEAVLFQPGIGGTCTVCGELHGSEARFCSHCGAAIGAAPVETVAEEAVAAEPAAAEDPVVKPSRRFWRRRRGAPAAAGEAEPTGEAEAEGAAASDDTAVLAPAADDAPKPTAGAPAAEPAAETPAAEATPEPPAETPAAEATPKPATDASVAEAAPTPASDDAPIAEAADDAPATDAADASAPQAEGDDPATQDAPRPAADEEPRDPFAGTGNGHAEDGAAPPPGLSSGDPLATRRSRS